MKQVVITLLVAGVAYTSAQGGPHRPYCQTENGFDYPGNDIANVSAPDSNPCCSACDTHQGCKAWTWSNYNGGTCWLKSKRGDIVVNKDTKSAMLFNGYQPVCQVRQDLDFEGNDLARVDGKTANDCCEACRNQLGCRAYSWNNYMGGSCWLKSKRDKVVYKAGVQSAEAYPSSYEPLCVPRENVDFVGNNIGNASSPNPDACCAICGGRPYCRAYSWNNYNGGTCWLKNVVGMAVAKQGVQSGQLSDNPSSVCVTESGFDYKGADIANEPSTDAGLCCAICYEHAGCKAYTWSNYQGGTCWLKGDGYTRVASAGTVSGKATPY